MEKENDSLRMILKNCKGRLLILIEDFLNKKYESVPVQVLITALLRLRVISLRILLKFINLKFRLNPNQNCLNYHYDYQ